MGTSQQNTGDLFKGWSLSEGSVYLKMLDSARPVSAVDIVRVEFKGLSSLQGISLVEKPSEQLSFLRFNRFPCELRIRLLMPSSTLLRPILELMAVAGSHSYSIPNLPVSDQIVLDGKEWYPLIPDNVQEVRELLKVALITQPGTLSLRQALELVKAESSLISICHAQGSSPDVVSGVCDLEQALADISDKGFRATLYPYQKDGFSWLKSISEEGLGCILADEMGLGKTLQVIALLSYFKYEWGQPALIIAPATLLENWRREFARFSPGVSVYVHSGNGRTGFPSKLMEFDVTVCSYDTAVRDQGLFGMIDWGFIALDEAQAIKNPDTRRAIAVKGLRRRAAVAVTGTPVENRLADLWSIMDFSCPGLLGSRALFESNYSDTHESAARLETIVTPLPQSYGVRVIGRFQPHKSRHGDLNAIKGCPAGGFEATP